MSSEQKQVAQLLENKKEYTEGPFQYTEGSIRNNTIILMKCGIGKVNAAAGTVELIRTFQPDCVISTGVAGGIDSCLKIMDVVVSRQVVYHDVWNGKKQYIQLATGISYRAADGELVNCEHEAIGNMAIAFVGTSGVQMGWLASQADMLAEDWIFAE